jgi:UDP-GlcNAc:undecaprenyl-phosphate GlcNAc-1-phosphate transferase
LADLWVLLAAATVLMGLGLADDRRGLDWRLRLAVQTAVAAAVVCGRGWQATAFVELPWLMAGLSVLWIVALVNSFNMLDNMDGLSAGVASIVAAVLAAIVLWSPRLESTGPQLFVGGFLLVLVGALLGFLWHNRPPAKLFMGDAGSYFIGFCIGVITLLATFANYGGGMRHTIFAPLCVLAIPLYDLSTVLLIRWREGRNPFQGDTSHLSHRLVDLGFSKATAVLTVYLMTATCGLAGLLLPRLDAVGAVLDLLLVACVLAVIAVIELTARRRMRLRGDGEQPK